VPVLAALLVPGKPLEFVMQRASAIEEQVGGFYGAVHGVQLWRRDAPLGPAKLLAPDVGINSPDLYPRQDEPVAAFLASIGGPDQPIWAGTLAVVGIDSWEGGWPESLSDHQVALLAAAYRVTVGPIAMPNFPAPADTPDVPVDDSEP